MKFSYKWLQGYFEKELPRPQALADLLTMRIFEVEGIEEAAEGSDSVIDVKILPDRAGYAYAHLNLAREIDAITDAKCGFGAAEYHQVSADNVAEAIADKTEDVDMPEISVMDQNKVPVFTARMISGIADSESPAWLKRSLAAVGQRSISLIVDLTNFVMLDVGQPMHAFDADKIAGSISIRHAVAGEKVILLDGREVSLDSETLVIADDEGALDIAGIKGGKKAEVDANTQRIIITAGNFDAAYIRKTSQKVAIKNDSSKRYENGVTKERAFVAQREFLALLKAERAGISHGPLVVKGLSAEEAFAPRASILIDPAYVSARIGIDISPDKIRHTLSLLEIRTEDAADGRLEAFPPLYRGDLSIQEDVIEEIGRLCGYESLQGAVPDAAEPVPQLASFFYANIARDILASIGFSEIYTHTLVEKGDIPLANPLTVDRSHMRNALGDGVRSALCANVQHIDLLGGSESIAHDVRAFEIGHVFFGKKESWSLAFGIATKDGKLAGDKVLKETDAAIAALSAAFGPIEAHIRNRQAGSTPAEGGAVPASFCLIEIDFEGMLATLPDPQEFQSQLAAAPVSMSSSRFVPFSPYPHMVRDIAVFIPGPTGRAHELRDLIWSAAGGSDSILRLVRQFDEFEKKDKESGNIEKTSYGFRMVFQSHQRTLTEAEVQGIMDAILLKISEKGNWEAR